MDQALADTGQGRLFTLLTPVVKERVPAQYVDDLVKAVVEALYNNSPHVGIKKQVLEKCNNKPVCWLCGFRIFMDEPENTDAAFSLDHVKKQENGGERIVENLRPAHRLCNSVRHTDKKRKRIIKRLENLKKHIAKRQKAEEGIK